MVNILIVDDHKLMRCAVREVLEKEAHFTVVAEACNGLEAEEQAALTQPDVVLMDLDLPGCDGFEATGRVLARSPQSRVVIFTASHEEHHVFQALQCGAIGYITKDIEPDALVHAIHCAARNDLCIPSTLATRVLAHIRSTWRSHPHASSLPRRSSATAYAYRTPRRKARRTSTPTEHHLPIEATNTDATEPAIEASPSVVQSASVGDDTISSSGAPLSDTASEGATEVIERCDPPLDAPIPIMRPLTEREQEILDLMRRGRKNREIAGELRIAESTVHKHVQNIFEKLNARNRTEAIYFSSFDEQMYAP